MTAATIIMWFRNDLRLTDNAAFHAAAVSGASVVPVYILDDDAPGRWRMGGASRWWLDGSLTALHSALESLGSRLILTRGPTRDVLLRLAEETNATAIHCSRAYEPWSARLEHELKADCDRAGIDFKRYGGAILFEPETIRTKDGEPFKVYTPFSRAALARGRVGESLPAPRRITSPTRWPKSEKLAAWNLKPTKPDWAAGLRNTWQPGEKTARAALKAFIKDGLADYHKRRDLPGVRGTSRLSPHLHHGEISARQCWLSVRTAADSDHAVRRGAEVLLRELLWREFANHLLFHIPELPDKPFREQFRSFPWSSVRTTLKAWQAGKTGYPIVDAGMRELWTTGWMHNRVRMVAASFLIKHLMLPWQKGEAWFWDTLVDGDLAANATNWQWVAGSGVDAAPYFRIFNPVTQGQKFDPSGDYVRTWCPELAKLDPPYIHAPWTAEPATLEAADIRLGKDYPRPIVDHTEARERALAAFNGLKKG